MLMLIYSKITKISKIMRMTIMLKINFKKNNNNFKLKKRLIKKKNKTGGNSNLLIKIKDRIII